MKVQDFDYHLPEELIAQTPLDKRSDSRLLVLNKDDGAIEHSVFSNITSFLKPSDVLVVNNTSVIPARLFGEKEDTKASIELLLLEEIKPTIWECLVKKARKIKVGTIVSFNHGQLRAECVGVFDEGIRHFKMHFDGIFYELLDQLGETPLPPYIHEQLDDPDRYQTVYNEVKGSAAAPTAGLHFTKPLLAEIKALGVRIVHVTLHVGLGTFRPVKVDDIKDHDMHEEYYHMPLLTADILNKAKANNQRIVAVGTTSLRTLETVMKKHGTFLETSGYSDIFIYPGYTFKGIDALITNFHLPKSTLVMLVSALAGSDTIKNAYQEAIKERYRFFSFGDSMFIK